MWHNATSMRPVIRTVLVVVIAVVAGVAGFVGGWYAHAAGASSGSPGPTTLSIIAAGSLAPILPNLASSFASATPDVDAPTSAQLYEGSTAALTTLTLPGQPYDLFVSADYRLIPQHLEPPGGSVTTWEAVFAADPMVLAYAPGASGLAGINSSNWYQKIVNAGVTLGTPNASVDPLGANAIFTLELTDALTGQRGGFYGHFFSGGVGALAVPTAATKIVSENVAATALSTGEVSTFLIYRSYAKVDRLSYIVLNTSVDLGSYTAVDVARYGTVSTTVLSGSSTAVHNGAPVLFALTVPEDAPDYALGVTFAAYLLSNSTAATWSADGFVPLAPPWTDAPTKLPAALAGTAPSGVAPLPTYLAALLT
jgi:molybdate/tungstate transport system substrate-binding protein